MRRRRDRANSSCHSRLRRVREHTVRDDQPSAPLCKVRMHYRLPKTALRAGEYHDALIRLSNPFGRRMAVVERRRQRQPPALSACAVVAAEQDGGERLVRPSSSQRLCDRCTDRHLEHPTIGYVTDNVTNIVPGSSVRSLLPEHEWTPADDLGDVGRQISTLEISVDRPSTRFSNGRGGVKWGFASPPLRKCHGAVSSPATYLVGMGST